MLSFFKVPEWQVGVAVAPRCGLSDAYRPEYVRALVRRALAELVDAPAAGPLSSVIQSGQSVLLKPNWVPHVN